MRQFSTAAVTRVKSKLIIRADNGRYTGALN